ncbi:hypothetical protein CHM34_06985 [Paludifilum halophilum]|uniref:Thymidylate synthase (FAD) n=1 Tax=Paludifilum halophilum TaxID=1642702 RepID=A0A235B8E8_9BACL|nr:hypothetical protein CHM34_06985 [Paludifilum halophilum]
MVEHLNYTFAIEGLSRSALAQLTRHRHMSFSVQSQRYVKFGSWSGTIVNGHIEKLIESKGELNEKRSA